MRVFVLGLCLLLNLPSSAETVRAKAGNFVLTRSLSLDKLIDSAGLIFRGRVNKIEYQIVDGLNIRKVSFVVSDPIKGLAADRVSISEWASIRSPLTSPLMRSQEHVFFFHQPSSKGLTSLVGMEQGLVSMGRSQHINNRFPNKKLLSTIEEDTTDQIKFSTKVQTQINNYEALKQYCIARNDVN
jgi:hypothetical protein